MLRAKQVRHIGTPYNAVVLGSCDVGRAILEDGTHVYITWGRNLSRMEAENLEKQGFQVVYLGRTYGPNQKLEETFELIVPKLMELCMRTTGQWSEVG